VTKSSYVTVSGAVSKASMRVLACFLWVQGADDHVVSMKKRSVALIVEGDSDEELDIAVGPRVPMPNIVPDDDSDVT
jgi:hypothetical protein